MEVQAASSVEQASVRVGRKQASSFETLLRWCTAGDGVSGERLASECSRGKQQETQSEPSCLLPCHAVSAMLLLFSCLPVMAVSSVVLNDLDHPLYRSGRIQHIAFIL